MSGIKKDDPLSILIKKFRGSNLEEKDRRSVYYNILSTLPKVHFMEEDVVRNNSIIGYITLLPDCEAQTLLKEEQAKKMIFFEFLADRATFTKGDGTGFFQGSWKSVLSWVLWEFKDSKIAKEISPENVNLLLASL